MKTLLKILIVPFITICIVTISIIVFYYMDAPGSKNPNIRIPAEDNTGKSLTASETHKSKDQLSNPQISIPQDFVYPADGLRDPFQQVSAQPSVSTIEQPSITLAGIIWDEENPVAIITDSAESSHIVRIGEKIDTVEILDIQLKSVTIKRDGKTQELEL